MEIENRRLHESDIYWILGIKLLSLMSRILLYQARRVPKNLEISKVQLISEQNQQKTRHSTFDVFLVCWLLLK